jgi:hypothetical protein
MAAGQLDANPTSPGESVLLCCFYSVYGHGYGRHLKWWLTDKRRVYGMRQVDVALGGSRDMRRCPVRKRGGLSLGINERVCTCIDAGGVAGRPVHAQPEARFSRGSAETTSYMY